MARWRFLDYYTDGQPPQNVIMDWLQGQDKRVKVVFEATLHTLEGVEDWSDDEVLEFKFFKEGPFVGLSQLRFHMVEINKDTRKPTRRRFRIPGIWKPEHHEFILLTGCEKSGRMKLPPDAFEVAMALKLAWEKEGRGSIYEHK